MNSSGINGLNISWLSDRASVIDSNRVEGGKSFSSIFRESIENVKTTDAELQKQQYLLATGKLDDPHSVPIAAAKAQMSVDMLVQLRNKTVEAYNETMRINL